MNGHGETTGDGASGRDVMVSRLLDGRAGPAEWRMLRSAVRGDDGVWDLVIDSSEDQATLARVVNVVAEGTACADVHEAAAMGRVLNIEEARGGGISRSGKLGWVLAACLAVGMAGLVLREQAGRNGAQNTNQAGVLSGLTSGDLMSKYFEAGKKEGKVLGELPQRVVLDSRPAANGKGYEVLYIRQVLERAVVDDMYKVGSDDAGRPVMVPVGLPGKSMGPM